jgi:MEMO1 family protein
LLWTARRRGLDAHVLDLRNSGDTAGSREQVVGYGAYAFTESRS